jgi:DEAD/DEAH box helicase domain-containing protein
MGAIHGLEHAMIGIMPLAVICDRNDLGGISIPFHPQTGGAAVFVYDGRGGAGLCRRGFSRLVELLELTLDAVAGCECELGCPSCVHSPKCGSGNRPMDKAGCVALCRGLLAPAARPEPVPAAAPAPSSRSVPREKGGDGPLHFCVFDLETKRSAAEVGGWHRAERMGVSMGVVYDSREERFFAYREEEMEKLVDRLFSCDLVVGFNNLRFDNRVLSAYTGRDLAALPTLDILQEIIRRLGYRLSLDRVAEHTLGAKKSADGLAALRWYAQGRFDLIEEYCRKDVEITRDIYLFGRRNGHILFANKAGEVVRCPVDFGRPRRAWRP